jgi:hypothetical protein
MADADGAADGEDAPPAEGPACAALVRDAANVTIITIAGTNLLARIARAPV